MCNQGIDMQVQSYVEFISEAVEKHAVNFLQTFNRKEHKSARIHSVADLISSEHHLHDYFFSCYIAKTMHSSTR